MNRTRWLWAALTALGVVVAMVYLPRTPAAPAPAARSTDASGSRRAPIDPKVEKPRRQDDPQTIVQPSKPTRDAPPSTNVTKPVRSRPPARGGKKGGPAC